MKRAWILSPLFVLGLVIGNLGLAASNTVNVQDLQLVEESVTAPGTTLAQHHHGHHHHGHHHHGHHHHHIWGSTGTNLGQVAALPVVATNLR